MSDIIPEQLNKKIQNLPEISNVSKLILNSNKNHFQIRNSLSVQTFSFKKSITCLVILLDGAELLVQLDKNAKGEALIKKVCNHINLLEADYFSCSYQYTKDIRLWLNPDKKILNQVTKNNNYTFHFGVKFYPPNPLDLQETITRYQLCLQIQRDIISGKLPCSFVTLALLGSYTLQSCLGDYIEEKHKKENFTNYLKSFICAQITNENLQCQEFLDKLTEFHKSHKGLSASNSDNLYLENASKLALYGIEMFKAKDSRNEEVSLGVSHSGLVVYKNNLRLYRISWSKMLKMSFRGSTFTILHFSSRSNQSELKYKYELSCFKLSKCLWQLAVEHHAFFRLHENGPIDKQSFINFWNNLGFSNFQYQGRTEYQSKIASSQNTRQPPHFIRKLLMPSDLSKIIDLSIFDNQLKNLNINESICTKLKYPPISTTEEPLEENYAVDFCSSFFVPVTFISPLNIDKFSNNEALIKDKNINKQKSIDKNNNSYGKVHHAYYLNNWSPDISCSSRLTNNSALHANDFPSTPSNTSNRSDFIRTQTKLLTCSRNTNMDQILSKQQRIYNDDINNDKSNNDDDDEHLSTLVSSHSHTSKSHTVEITTYQTEKDGVIETRVEKKVILEFNKNQPQQDQNKILLGAIEAAITPEILIDKIQIKTVTELDPSTEHSSQLWL